MSLVIDANSNNGFPKQSNEVIGFKNYPDFNQILIKPSLPITSGYPGCYIGGRTTPESGTEVAKSINGTVINFWSSDILSPTCFQGSGNGGGYGDNGAFSGVGKMRIGLDYQFEAGRVIGKYIYFGLSFKNNYADMDISSSGTVAVGLLHSDGTISYLPDISFAFTAKMNIPGVMQFFSQTNPSGLTTLEGDYVIVDVNMTGIGDATYCSCTFGRQGGSSACATTHQGGSDTCRPYPIQISVD